MITEHSVNADILRKAVAHTNSHPVLGEPKVLAEEREKNDDDSITEQLVELSHFFFTPTHKLPL